MAATINDVAKRAGVSPMSVSRVINHKAGVSETKRARIELALKELDYKPNRTTKHTPEQRSRLIGLIVPDIANPFFAPLVQRAEKTAAKSGFRVLICNSESDLRYERDYIHDLVAHNVEGLIVAPVSDYSRPHLKWLHDRGFPLVLLDREVARFESDTVTLENRRSAVTITNHLIGIGHKKVCLVADSSDVSTGRERTAGFLEAMKAADMTADGSVVVTTPDIVGGHRAAQQIFDMSERPEAILAVNNMAALGLIEAFRDSEVTIPDDIALACFDDIQHLAVIAPFLTVIEQPTETMATVAAEMLIEKIRGDASREFRRARFPGRLIIRKSCGGVSQK